MLELRLRFSDLSGLFRGKQVGHEQRPHLDLPGLRTGAHDGVKLVGPEALYAMFNQGPRLFPRSGIGTHSDNNVAGELMMSKKKETSLVRSSAAEYLTFIAASGADGVEAVYADENVWLTQKMMAQLYDVEVPTINYHLKKVFSDSELQEEAVIRNFRITAADGKSYDTKHYNLAAIIAVGYKVNSERAVQFRKWATGIVEEFAIKGYAMDDERLKSSGSVLTEKYFEDLLQRVREVRLSERKFYQKITDIYATALDYDPSAAATQRFFAAVQNKLHYAIHGQTAAEVIVDRADHRKEYMGLTNWEGAPKGKIHKYDVSIAKNYLSEFELAQMQRIVSAYLDMAEVQATRRIPMTMADWEERLSGFLKLWDRDILQDAGKVSTELAKAHAESEFEKYRIVQDRMFESDFDRMVKLLAQSRKALPKMGDKKDGGRQRSVQEKAETTPESEKELK